MRALWEIAFWGQRLQQPDWQSPEARASAFKTLRWNLSAADAGLGEALKGDVGLELLEHRMAHFRLAPAGTAGAQGPSRILAELIVHDAEPGTLGFELGDEDPKDDVESVRRKLERDMDKIRRRLTE